MNHSTQNSRILAVLIQARSGWVPAPELAQISLQYGRAVYELRRLGFCIENRSTWVDGKRRGWFRLLAWAEARARFAKQNSADMVALAIKQVALRPATGQVVEVASIPQQSTASDAGAESLFGDLYPDRSYRE